MPKNISNLINAGTVIFTGTVAGYTLAFFWQAGKYAYWSVPLQFIEIGIGDFILPAAQCTLLITLVIAFRARPILIAMSFAFFVALFLITQGVFKFPHPPSVTLPIIVSVVTFVFAIFVAIALDFYNKHASDKRILGFSILAFVALTGALLIGIYYYSYNLQRYSGSINVIFDSTSQQESVFVGTYGSSLIAVSPGPASTTKSTVTSTIVRLIPPTDFEKHVIYAVPRLGQNNDALLCKPKS